MSHAPETLERSAEQSPGGAAAREPGVILVFRDGAATFEVTALPRGGLEIGRQPGMGLAIADGHMSRQHVRVAREDGRWHVRDLGSRNGTFVDGRRVIDEHLDDGRHLVRVGSSLLLLVPEVPEAEARAVIADDEGHVVGPTLGAQLETLRRFSTSNRVVHLRGETGSGKELAARRFHLAGPNPAGPFVAVNCGAIPRELAEGLLFGARRGAYTGAVADTDGYLLSAAGGTVFLDEVGELAPAVQAKLLRVLETHEVVQLGASRGQKVDLRICSATHKDLRAEAAEGRFREDLFFRLGRPVVVIPPLRQRVEEIPFLLRRAVDRIDPALRVDVSLVEACLLRQWPGNVRELLTEAREAARRAVDEDGPRVDARHLDGAAGRALASGTHDSRRHPAPHAAPRQPRSTIDMLTVDNVVAALRDERGNLSRAARALGVHRTQIKRFIAKHNIAVLREEPESQG